MRSINKGAIITGSSSGIGKEAAKRLVAKRASVVLSGRDEAKLQAAAKEIGGSSSQIRAVAGDIAKPATGAALVETAERNFGGLDILVSNAGSSNRNHSLKSPRRGTTGFSTSFSRGNFSSLRQRRGR